MNEIKFEAVYDEVEGVFKPLTPLPIREGKIYDLLVFGGEKDTWKSGDVFQIIIKVAPEDMLPTPDSDQ